jgi:hypothetical protein
LLRQVAMFLQLHRTTSTLLDEVSHWGEARPTFDAENFRIDMADESKAVSEVEESDDVFDDDTVRSIAQVNSPDSLSHHYRYEEILVPTLFFMLQLLTIAK